MGVSYTFWATRANFVKALIGLSDQNNNKIYYHGGTHTNGPRGLNFWANAHPRLPSMNYKSWTNVSRAQSSWVNVCLAQNFWANACLAQNSWASEFPAQNFWENACQDQNFWANDIPCPV